MNLIIFFLLPLVFNNLIIFYKKRNRNHMGFAGNDGLYISSLKAALLPLKVICSFLSTQN